MKDTSRRSFLKVSGALAVMPLVFGATGALSPARAGEAKRKAIRLGGPAFSPEADPDKLAQAHRELGYSAAYCPNVGVKESDKLRAIRQAFERHDVVLAEVGRWCNLLDPDPEKRRKNLENVTDGLAVADALGARCCVDIAGSFNPTSWFGPHPKNFSKEFFDGAVENARKIIDAVKPARARFCYEMMGWAFPDTPENYRKLIKAIDRKAFGVHLDPCNAINSPEKYYNNTGLLNDCFDKLGPWIVSCHAKDLTWDIEMNVHFREVVPGTGTLDYVTFLRRLAQLPEQPPLMLEHLAKKEEYDAARQHILKVGREAGLTFA